jgi:hypothetical protein
VALQAVVDKDRPAAETCCPFCNHAPCTFVVDDLCCPLTVDMQGSPNVVAFEDALNAFRAAGCGVACPAIPCPVAPSNTCDQTTSLCKQ